MLQGGSRTRHGPAPYAPDDFGIGRLFARVRDAVIVADAASGRIVLWNPAAEAIFGYPAEEALGMEVAALMPPAERERHRAGLARFADTGRGPLVDSGRAVERPACTRDGEERVVELSLTPIEDAAVPGRFVMALVRDVTERHRAETALREAEATYRGMFEHAAEGIFQTAPDGRLLAANPSLARILGFDSPRELIEAFAGGEYQAYVDVERRDAFFNRLRAEGRV